MLRHLLVLSSLAGLTVGQAPYLFPSDHAGIANGTGSTNNFPYAYGISRVQSLYEAWDLGMPNGFPISAIGFRQDGNLASTGHSVQLEVRMAQTSLTAANCTTTFANNATTTWTTVYGPAIHTLPSLTTATTGQVLWLNLTTPFPYDSSLNLIVEFRVTANNNGNAAFTYYLDGANFVSPVTAGNNVCQHSGNQTSRLYTTSAGVALGGRWYMYVDRAPSSSLGFWLATVNAPLVAPYSLASFVPGIPASCNGQLNLQAPLYVNTFTTSVSGNANWNYVVPTDRLLWNDAIVSSQAVILDLFAPGGMVSSTADQVQFGIQPANTVIYAQGNASATTGSLQRNYGLVTLFQ